MRKWPLILLAASTLLWSGCNLAPETTSTQILPITAAIELRPTQTPSPTLTAEPSPTQTPTPLPTSTHTATRTPAPTNTATATPIPLGGGSGQIACMACAGSSGISLVNPDGTNAVFLTDKRSRGISFAWSRNGDVLAFFTIIGTGEQAIGLTCVINTLGHTEKCLEVGGGSFALSPDGTQLAVNFRYPDNGLNVVDIKSGEQTLLVAGDISTIDWSPDGSKLAYQKGPHIYVINRDGSGEVRVVSSASDPLWSPDGVEIAYISGYYDERSLVLLRADGTKDRLTPELPLSNSFMWTTDGKYIVFLVDFANNPEYPQYDLYAVEVHSKTLTRLTNVQNIKSYALSPDGTKIAFTQGYWWKDECTQSFIMDLDGSQILEWKGTNCNTEVGPWRP